jgi:CubicO group peptidase (beta-lactamase class C family)
MPVCWICWCLSVALWGDPQAPEERVSPQTRLARVAEYLVEERARQHIPGVSVAVVLDGKLVWSRGFGLADVENEVPATPKTVYRLASISKMITAVAVLQLVQEGKVGLNASVRDYVPELPDKGERISVEHLLSGLSGIRAYKSREELFSREPYRRLVDSVESFKDDPLIAVPGRRFINSPYGYTLLGLVVERVSGLTFGDYLEENIFEPSGMSSSGLDDLSGIVAHRGRGYVLQKDGSLRNSFFVDLSARYPGEGMAGTVEDLARFAIAFMTGKLLESSMIKVMTTEYRTEAGESTRYGLGCFVREENGRRIIGHGGWQPQVASFLLIVPDSRAAVAVLANLEQADVKTISLSVAEMLLGESPPVP